MAKGSMESNGSRPLPPPPSSSSIINLPCLRTNLASIRHKRKQRMRICLSILPISKLNCFEGRKSIALMRLRAAATISIEMKKPLLRPTARSFTFCALFHGWTTATVKTRNRKENFSSFRHPTCQSRLFKSSSLFFWPFAIPSSYG